MKWTNADKRRRWFGLFYVITAGGMFVWGQTLLKPYLTGWAFVCYWIACFGLTFLAILTALLDIWVIRLRQRSQEAEAAKRVMAPPRKASNSDLRPPPKPEDPSP